MRTLQVKIPDELKDFVDAQVASGLYHTAGDLFSDLLQWHKRHLEDLALRDQFLAPIRRKNGTITKKDLDNAWDKIREKRLIELRTDIQIGIDQLDRGEYYTYHSVEECVADIKAEARKLLNSRRRNRA